MSTTWTSTRERDVAVIGELDEVALLEAVDGWAIGTTGTVVAVSSTSGTIEIRGYLGESLDFLDVPIQRHGRTLPSGSPSCIPSRHLPAGLGRANPLALP